MSSNAWTAERTFVSAPDVPQPNGTFSPAVIHNGIVYCSGVIGMNHNTKSMVEGSIAGRTVQCLDNLARVLEASGSRKENILKVTIYVTNIKDVPEMNNAYNSYFPEPRPARCTVEVSGLALGTDIEIECIGFVNKAE